MRKPTLVGLASLALVSALIYSGCGGSTMSTNTQTTAQTGTVAVFGSDAPLCDVFSFQVTITSAELVPQNGGAPVSLISSPLTIDFARLVDFATILQLSKIPAANYSKLTMTMTNPSLMVMDVTTTPPMPVAVPKTVFSNNSTTMTVTVNLQNSDDQESEMDLGDNQASGLKLDFNLRDSVLTDATGQVTGVVDPIVTAKLTSSQTGDDHEGLGQTAELHGLVQSVNTTSSGNFTGSFAVQVLGGTGPVFTIEVNSATNFEGVADLGALTANQFVEVDAIVDASGDILAKEVEVPETEPPDITDGVFLGPIVAVTRDGSGNAISFIMVVRGEYPEDLTESVPRYSPLAVNLNANGTTTNFRLPSWLNPAGLAFNAASVGVGEHVGVRGTIVAGSPISVDAQGVFLRPRTVLGNFTQLLSALDDKAGGFALAPCGSLFQGNPMTALTFESTFFSGVSGLTGLSPKPTIATRGLLLYEQSSGASNGAAWTAPTWVLEAHSVHQFPQ
jgi:hypothetical protein